MPPGVALDLREAIDRVNEVIALQLENAQKALRGESVFGPEEIGKLRRPLQEMEPFVAEASKLRREHPELAAPLELYRSQLEELHRALDQIQVMLLARQASILAGRVHLEAVDHWIAALRQTR